MEINTKKHCILLILVISLAIFLRVWRISEIFEIHDFHEAYGIQILKTGVLNHILKYPILTFLPVPFSYFLQIPFFYFLGQTVFALKLPFAISGILTIFFLYLFTKEFYSKEEALLASFILTIFPSHVVLSTLPLQYIFNPFFVTLVIYLLYKYYRTKRGTYFYLAGLFSGLGVMVRLSFLFFLIPLVVLAFVFKISVNKSFRKIMIAFLFFILSGYPLILLHLEENLAIVYRLIKRPQFTIWGDDLRDVVGNLYKGLTQRFPNFFVIYCEVCDIPPNESKVFNFFNIFLFSLIAVLIIKLWTANQLLKTSSRSHNNRNIKSYLYLLVRIFRKDLFVLILLFCLLILTSTITMGVFHTEEYVIASPLISIIIARGINEILKISKFHTILFFTTISVFCLVLFFSTYPFFTAFFNRSPSSCVRYIPELVKIINEMNYSGIISEEGVFHDALAWYGVGRGVRYKFEPGMRWVIFDIDKGRFVFSQEIKYILNRSYEVPDVLQPIEKILYVFQPPECEIESDLRERFQEEASKYNRRVIKERDVIFENMTYTLYRVV